MNFPKRKKLSYSELSQKALKAITSGVGVASIVLSSALIPASLPAKEVISTAQEKPAFIMQQATPSHANKLLASHYSHSSHSSHSSHVSHYSHYSGY
jgi:hypothetical protein